MNVGGRFEFLRLHLSSSYHNFFVHLFFLYLKILNWLIIILNTHAFKLQKIYKHIIIIITLLNGSNMRNITRMRRNNFINVSVKPTPGVLMNVEMFFPEISSLRCHVCIWRLSRIDNRF